MKGRGEEGKGWREGMEEGRDGGKGWRREGMKKGRDEEHG